MKRTMPGKEEKVIVERAHLPSLFAALVTSGYQVVGPVIHDDAIVYDRLSALEDLPVGWTDRQDKGSYRLQKRDDEALFGYNLGPDSWKKFLQPPVIRLWKVKRNANKFLVHQDKEEIPRLALFGVRPCELHAIARQEKVLLSGEHIDPHFKARLENTCLIVVNCSQAGGNCFCSSMNTGPGAIKAFDLALTEMIDAGSHYFVVEIGSKMGAGLLKKVNCRPLSDLEEELANEVLVKTAGRIDKRIKVSGLKELLYQNLEHPYWDELAKRCLNCGNCTMVCPTCFCHTVEDTTDLRGTQAERWRKWDSCFTVDFSYIHGGSIRSTAKTRYRHWLTHKFAAHLDQFGLSGCVGCGRCITWCPSGIDLTEELPLLTASSELAGEEAPWIKTR